MTRVGGLGAAVTLVGVLLAVSHCRYVPRPTQAEGESATCQLISSGWGDAGKVEVRAEVVARDLIVPWALAFLGPNEFLVTERPGRLKRVKDGKPIPTPLVEFPESETSEGGLLGIALHPEFERTRWFYLYRTLRIEGKSINRVERYLLSDDHERAKLDNTILDRIPAAKNHNGGRIRFGPDGMLYIGTGDAGVPDNSQKLATPAGKLLRIRDDGSVPDDNPFAPSPAFLLGIRNTQGFDWIDPHTLIVTDHGPSGEMLRFGHDEISVATAGQNLGWPRIYGCEQNAEYLSPNISWEQALPPGGAALYRGKDIPEWRGDLLVASLGAKQLHRVSFERKPPYRVTAHEHYFKNRYGRLREAVMGPDNQLYVTTSNCDGRGECPEHGDAILRISATSANQR